MRWRDPVFVGLILALTPIAAASEETGVSVRDAWVRETPRGVAMTAGYMVLQNKTSRPQVLVAARSSGFETVTIHRTIAKEGMTGMEHAPQIELLPNRSEERRVGKACRDRRAAGNGNKNKKKDITNDQNGSETQTVTWTEQ